MDLRLEFDLALMVAGTCPKHELGIFSGINYSDQVLWVSALCCMDFILGASGESVTSNSGDHSH